MSQVAPVVPQDEVVMTTPQKSHDASERKGNIPPSPNMPLPADDEGRDDKDVAIVSAGRDFVVGCGPFLADLPPSLAELLKHETKGLKPFLADLPPTCLADLLEGD